MARGTSSGITLVETVIYISLSSMLLLALSAFFVMSTTARVKNQSINEVNQQGVFAMEQMVQAVRNATAVTAPTAATNGSSLSLTMPAAAQSPTAFSLSGTTLQVKEGAAAALPLTNGLVQVSNLSITNLSRSGTNGIVRISFTLARTKNIDRNEYDYQKTFTTSVSLRP
jgi:Tfp pilus assembly protein PilW